MQCSFSFLHLLLLLEAFLHSFLMSFLLSFFLQMLCLAYLAPVGAATAASVGGPRRAPSGGEHPPLHTHRQTDSTSEIELDFKAVH